MDTYAYEVAAEQEALYRSVHLPMRNFYVVRDDLLEKFGPYPSFWRDFASWPAFKEVYREYVRWQDTSDRTEKAALNSTTQGPKPAADGGPNEAQNTSTLGAPNGVAGAPKKRKRWSEMPAEPPLEAEAEADAAALMLAPVLVTEPPKQAKRKSRFQNSEPDSVLSSEPTGRMRTRFGQRILAPHTTLCPQTASPIQEALFVYRIRIEEINARLMLVPTEARRIETDPARSPSPPPEYDSTGKKTNSREQRMTQALLQSRDKILERMSDLNPSLCGPTGPKFLRKLYIPWREYPHYNFIGLIIGPRGNTQKRLENETHCRIAIRGRGSGKESKLGRGEGADSLPSSVTGIAGLPLLKGRYNPDDDDELHVAIMGERLSEIEAAEKLVADLLTPMDEEANDWKRLQLMELAKFNGTLQAQSMFCNYCQDPGHRAWECPNRDKDIKRANVKCAICGDGSHVTADCKFTRGSVESDDDGIDADAAGIESEYHNFMSELTGTAPPETAASAGSSSAAGTTTTTAAAPSAAPMVPAFQMPMIPGAIPTMNPNPMMMMMMYPGAPYPYPGMAAPSMFPGYPGYNPMNPYAYANPAGFPQAMPRPGMPAMPYMVPPAVPGAPPLPR